jgi:hypothetical protein
LPSGRAERPQSNRRFERHLPPSKAATAPSTKSVGGTLNNRTLTGLAAVLFVAGCALGAVGLEPDVASPTASRFGILLAVASLPAWIVSSMRRAAEATEFQLTDAHVAGYQLALQHLQEAATASAPNGQAPNKRVPRQGGSGSDQTRRHDH